MPFLAFADSHEDYSHEFAANLFFSKVIACKDVVERWEKEPQFPPSLKPFLEKLIAFTEIRTAFEYWFLYSMVKQLDPKSEAYPLLSLIENEYEEIRDKFNKCWHEDFVEGELSYPDPSGI